MERIRNFIPYIYRFHLALFYIKGKYLDISKRYLNIDYVVKRKYYFNFLNRYFLEIKIMKIQEVKK